MSQGEAEWIKNATPKYGEDAADFWKSSITIKVARGDVSDSIINKLKKYTPEMLNNFALGIDPEDPKYSYLWTIGMKHASEQIAKSFGVES